MFPSPGIQTLALWSRQRFNPRGTWLLVVSGGAADIWDCRESVNRSSLPTADMASGADPVAGALRRMLRLSQMNPNSIAEDGYV